ncbi:desulfoferrodoxin [Candidatus Dojkabacteria bacterium]|nr:desulfoferrodoxin [Candidatus Dojkabacteria bacterium]
MQKTEKYRCAVCGNIVEVLHVGGGELICCGQPMDKLDPSDKDEGSEKHVPVIEKTEKGYKVRVGSIPHPMEESHYIEWIELVVDGVVSRKFLNYGDEPTAEFCAKGEEVTASEYCSVHGLWQSK